MSNENTPLLATVIGASVSNDKFDKIWDWKSSLSDHVRILLNAPYFFIAPFVLSPKAIETMQLSINSANKCPYCTGLHSEIGRMAGLSDASKVNVEGELSTDEEKENLTLFAEFGQAFGTHNGWLNHHGDEELQVKYDAIKEEYGELAAKCANGAAYSLMWGSTAGNTINNFLFQTLRGNIREDTNPIFEGILFLYYVICYTLIVITSKILKYMPEGVPEAVSIVLHIILHIIVVSFVLPYAIVGCLAYPFIGLENEPLPSIG